MNSTESSSGSEIYTLKYDTLKYQSPKAWLLIFDSNEVWLPKSQCQVDEVAMTVGIPAWLVSKNNLDEYIEV